MTSISMEEVITRARAHSIVIYKETNNDDNPYTLYTSRGLLACPSNDELIELSKTFKQPEKEKEKETENGSGNGNANGNKTFTLHDRQWSVKNDISVRVNETTVEQIGVCDNLALFVTFCPGYMALIVGHRHREYAMHLMNEFASDFASFLYTCNVDTPLSSQCRSSFPSSFASSFSSTASSSLANKNQTFVSTALLPLRNNSSHQGILEGTWQCIPDSGLVVISYDADKQKYQIEAQSVVFKKLSVAKNNRDETTGKTWPSIVLMDYSIVGFVYYATNDRDQPVYITFPFMSIVKISNSTNYQEAVALAEKTKQLCSSLLSSSSSSANMQLFSNNYRPLIGLWQYKNRKIEIRQEDADDAYTYTAYFEDHKSKALIVKNRSDSSSSKSHPLKVKLKNLLVNGQGKIYYSSFDCTQAIGISWLFGKPWIKIKS